MKILFDIGHPAHVHLFRNCAKKLEDEGCSIHFTARDKESSLALLDAFGFDYSIRGDIKKTMLGKASGMLSTDLSILRVAKRFKPDLLVGVHNPYTAQVARFLRKKSITFTDTENVGVASRLTFPFTDSICTPQSFREKLDTSKHVRYNGFHELAYLRPEYFKPDPAVLEEMGLSSEEPFIILRFISWAASHDVGLSGIQKGSELDFVHEIEGYGRVLITSERPLIPELEKYRIKCSPEKIHSLLNYASLYVGEGATMAIESAVLGTPAVHIESNKDGVATGNFCGVFCDLRDTYGLLDFYPTQAQALGCAVQLLNDPKSKKNAVNSSRQLMEEKVDVTEWMADFILGFPGTHDAYMLGRQKTF